MFYFFKDMKSANIENVTLNLLSTHTQNEFKEIFFFFPPELHESLLTIW